MLVLTLLKNRLIRTLLICLVSLLVGVFISHHFSQPAEAPKVVTVHDTTIVTVEKPVLTEKIITKILADPKDKAVIKALTDENAQLHVSIAFMTLAMAELTHKGEGPVVTIDPTVPDPDREFTDFQLHAKFNSKLFHYELKQSFEVLSTTGRSKDGSQVSLVKMFQIGPDGVRIPVPAKTTAIFADETTPHWVVSPRIQAGLGYTTTISKGEAGGVVAFQWLKHGRSPKTEDVKWAVLSPAVFVNKSTHDPGVLPASFNLGALKHQPFTNAWISPFVNRTRVGATLTATF